ncbi:hypothetical protein HHL16_08755 [Pseudoflavitalea sp. G-6-1-2]|uniref:DUF6934 family protein n=1 Tax=Pseudoflavitalea sp. G-6-1-2 TaxID=2728841 RepID=UPI00146BADA6|nr:hypothetical protein [Pseudoflavitalea sp. G-6-1-2]NML20961.1 hypothetical protein [Pseudoflavitalea sp. G-6-1-2]
MKVKIDLEDTYELLLITPDLREAAFHSCDKKGNAVLMKIQLKPAMIGLLPDVYNLSFGPPLPNGTIDDSAEISHDDLNKLFSSIILFALTFLRANPESSIGLDGSDDVRAYLYHRIFIGNRTYLSEYLKAFGVDWFARLMRSGDIERKNDGAVFFKPQSELLDSHRPAIDLYRYYVFRNI